MPNDFQAIILAQLGSPPPPTRSEREVVYDRLRAELDALFAGEGTSAEHPAYLALQHAIEAVEAELQSARESARIGAQATGGAARPQPGAGTGAMATHWRKAAAVAAAMAVLAGGAWYFLAGQREAAKVPGAVVQQKDAGADLAKDRDLAASDKARSFRDALRDGDAATAAFLLQSGFRPTRVELRAALLEVKYTPQIQAATAALAPDIGDIACGFTTLSEVRKPLTRASLFDAEDAFAIMKQVGQDQWRSMCATERAKWREALAKMEQQNIQYNKPDAEKKGQAEACVRRFSAREAMERWEQAHCAACPESHSSCEAYCPQAPKAADAEEARFFSFNRSDMSMATTSAPGKGRAELYCNLQYLTRPTDFDLANLQRFRNLASLFD